MIQFLKSSDGGPIQNLSNSCPGRTSRTTSSETRRPDEEDRPTARRVEEDLWSGQLFSVLYLNFFLIYILLLFESDFLYLLVFHPS